MDGSTNSSRDNCDILPSGKMIDMINIFSYFNNTNHLYYRSIFSYVTQAKESAVKIVYSH